MARTAEADYTWIPKPVADGVLVVQVYGWLFDDAGRVLLQETSGGFNLPGGSPEPVDVDLAATIVREAMEESQVEVSNMVYLGYERVARAGVPRALVRTVGRINAFHHCHPDPDTGEAYRRLMTTLHEAPELLNWGRSGRAQATAAIRVAEGPWNLPVSAPTLASTYIN